MKKLTQFENDVKTYGTQAESDDHRVRSRFENDVKTYGTQADGFVYYHDSNV